MHWIHWAVCRGLFVIFMCSHGVISSLGEQGVEGEAPEDVVHV